jgi:hypothetical protein
MMWIMQLKNITPTGTPLTATFLPEKGMNLTSYKWGDVEIIDQSTKDLFDDRFSGLGPLIGPHFYQRNPATLPHIKDETLFPHIANVHHEHRQDPFSHGIGRYAPWNAQATETKITAALSGKDQWMGVPLADLEGQQFQMTFAAELMPDGLHLDLSVTSDTDSLVGIHYYYRLPNHRGTLTSRVQNRYIVNRISKEIPKEWTYDSQHQLTYPLNQDTDFTFHPFPNPRQGQITLETEEYRLITTYTSPSQENSWQLYHPKGASYVCIEPISAQDPRAANLTASSISIHLQIDAP